MNYKTALLLVTAILTVASAASQPFGETRTYQRGFKAGRELTFDISNKYGTIHITNGRNDSISVKAEVIASSSNLQRMRKMLESVNVNMVQAGNSIRVNTDFGTSVGFLFEDFKNLTNKFINYENRLQVNYYITMPAETDLIIGNMYGDVYLEDVNARLTLRHSNGSIQAGMIKNASEINLTFVNGSVGGIESGSITASFSEINIGHIGDVLVAGRSSKIEIESAGALDLNSRRDRIVIGKTESMKIDSYFSTISAEEVSADISIKSTYGSITLPLISRSFGSLMATSQFTELYFGFEKGTTAAIDIKAASAQLFLPATDAKLETQVISAEKDESVVFGTIGSGSARPSVKIDVTRGSLRIVN